jgi:hypothetical protein
MKSSRAHAYVRVDGHYSSGLTDTSVVEGVTAAVVAIEAGTARHRSMARRARY